MGNIDGYIEMFKHPFYMVVGGFWFWFAVKWSLNREKYQEQKLSFWNDQKDEMLVSFIGCTLFLIFDDEILNIYYERILNQPDHPIELKWYYYLTCGYAADKIRHLIAKLIK